MANWMNLGQMLRLNAKKYPQTICLMDADRSFTYPETNQRVCRLAGFAWGFLVNSASGSKSNHSHHDLLNLRLWFPPV